MGRLFLVTPHYCLPIRFDDHDQDLLCRGMEGVDVRQQPPPVQPSPAAWRFFRIFLRSVTATAYIGMVVFALVGRHYFNWFPELQDPLTVAFIMFIALVQVGCVFMITQGDVETNSVTTAQGEQHL